jgi:hypothetical protein
MHVILFQELNDISEFDAVSLTSNPVITGLGKFFKICLNWYVQVCCYTSKTLHVLAAGGSLGMCLY